MVTDGTQPSSGDDDALVARVGAAALAGVHLVQIREPHLEGAALRALVERCVDAVRMTRTRIIVNDRLDVALAAGAHGVHLRGDSMPAARVRRVTPPGFLVGRSVHDATEAAGAAEQGGVDYLIFGTVFATPSKPDRQVAGVSGLGAAVAATAVPVLAIGGITRERLSEVSRTGAAGWAAIRLFNAPVETLQLILQQASLAFDTPEAAP